LLLNKDNKSELPKNKGWGLGDIFNLEEHIQKQRVEIA